MASRRFPQQPAAIGRADRDGGIIEKGKGLVSPFGPDTTTGGHRWEPARVECYAGYRGEETPRAVFLCGTRFPVAEVVSRTRHRDVVSGRTVEIFECCLEAGWTVSLERSADSSWRVRQNIFVPRIDLN
jgi:hypothetical protein